MASKAGWAQMVLLAMGGLLALPAAAAHAETIVQTVQFVAEAPTLTPEEGCA